MIKRLDRVKLTARAAAAFNNKRPSMFDWTARRGVVERISANKATAIVLWDGRKSQDYLPIRSMQSGPRSMVIAARSRSRSRCRAASGLWFLDHRAECGGRVDPSEGDAGDPNH